MWPKTLSEARRLIQQGGVRVDGVKVVEVDARTPVRPFILQCGKRYFMLIGTPDRRIEAESYYHKETDCTCWFCKAQPGDGLLRDLLVAIGCKE